MSECRTCKHFRPRPEDMPWPRAGVPKTAEGQCGLKRVGTDERHWRNGADSCPEWKGRAE